MTKYLLELRRRYWQLPGTYIMAAVILALGVLAVLYPPRVWWGYLVGGAGGVFLVLLSILEARRAWIAVDELSVHVSDLSGRRGAMPRGNVLAIEATGFGWRIRGRDGSVLQLRPIWPRSEVAALAQELGVPMTDEER